MIDALTLDQLRVLVAVAEAGSFSAAARRLGRVQSAVSQSIQTLEGMLGVALFDRAGKLPVLTEAGRAMVDEGRLVIDRVSALRAHARAMAEGTEPELSLALDPLFPTELMMQSLRALQTSFPRLPVALFTEGLGAPEQRLRDRVVRFAIYSPLATPGGSDLETAFLTNIAMVPVVAADHPLAKAAEPIGRDVLDGEIQLVLTDRSPLSQNQRGGIYSSRIWRFADLATRLDYLLAGFGWCHMPLHQVDGLIAAGRLKRLRTVPSDGILLPIHVVSLRDQRIGPAGQWLIADLRGRLEAWRPCGGETPA